MNDKIREKIKKITIFSKRLMQGSLTGDYLSAFKGTGLEFNQLREYHVGDEIRFIDWNSSAKKQSLGPASTMMIKQFIEERDRTIIMAIDISPSAFFSSEEELRSETIAHIASALAFIATHNKDKIGVLFFSDKVVKWIPPKRGKSHHGKILETLFSLTEHRLHRSAKSASAEKSCDTSILEALKFLINLKHKNAIVFMISDWIDEVESYSKFLKVASIKFDFVGVRILDKIEHNLSPFGLIEVLDPETNTVITIDTKKGITFHEGTTFHERKTSTKVPPYTIDTFLKKRKIEQEKIFSKYKISLLDLKAGKPFVNDIIKFFHQRTRKQI